MKTFILCDYASSNMSLFSSEFPFLGSFASRHSLLTLFVHLSLCLDFIGFVMYTRIGGLHVFVLKRLVLMMSHE